MTSVKSDLEDAEKQFSAFASKNATLDMTEQAKTMVTSGATLQGELIVARRNWKGCKRCTPTATYGYVQPARASMS